jgi:hypothetical protein
VRLTVIGRGAAVTVIVAVVAFVASATDLLVSVMLKGVVTLAGAV